MKDPGKPQTTIYYGVCPLRAGQLMLHTHTHSEYTIIIACPLQQRLHECVSMLIALAVPLWSIKRCRLHLLKFLSTVTTIRSLTICFTTVCSYQYHISNIPSKFFFTAARTCCSAQKMSAGPDAALHFQIFFDTLYKIMYNDY